MVEHPLCHLSIVKADICKTTMLIWHFPLFLGTLVWSDNEPRGLFLKPLVFHQVPPIYQLLSNYCHFPASLSWIKGIGCTKTSAYSPFPKLWAAQTIDCIKRSAKFFYLKKKKDCYGCGEANCFLARLSTWAFPVFLLEIRNEQHRNIHS